jgi:hypothetical protein
MWPTVQGNSGKTFIAVALFLSFLLYLALVFFKTTVSFEDDHIAFSAGGPFLACGAECMKVAHGFLYYGVFDLLRTASVSLLIGLGAGIYLLGGTPAAQGRLAVAMVICGPLVVISAQLGEVQFLARFILVAIGVWATVDGAERIVRASKAERGAS